MPDFPSPLKRLLHVRPYEVELLRPRKRPPPLAAVLLLAGAAVALAAVLAVRPAWQQREVLAGEESRLQATLDGLGADATARPGRSHASGKGGADAWDEAELVAAEVRRPWHALFDQLEAVQKADGSGVHLVQMGIDPRFASIQLVAEGKDLGKLVRFAQQLPGAGPIRTMSLTHHEWRDTLGAHVVTASLQGQLDETFGAQGAAPAATRADAAAPAATAATTIAGPGAAAGAGAGAGASVRSGRSGAAP